MVPPSLRLPAAARATRPSVLAKVAMRDRSASGVPSRGAPPSKPYASVGRADKDENRCRSRLVAPGLRHQRPAAENAKEGAPRRADGMFARPGAKRQKPGTQGLPSVKSGMKGETGDRDLDGDGTRTMRNRRPACPGPRRGFPTGRSRRGTTAACNESGTPLITARNNAGSAARSSAGRPGPMGGPAPRVRRIPYRNRSTAMAKGGFGVASTPLRAAEGRGDARPLGLQPCHGRVLWNTGQ
jgi:hypothetical protein